MEILCFVSLFLFASCFNSFVVFARLFLLVLLNRLAMNMNLGELVSKAEELFFHYCRKNGHRLL